LFSDYLGLFASKRVAVGAANARSFVDLDVLDSRVTGALNVTSNDAEPALTSATTNDVSHAVIHNHTVVR